LSAGRSFLHNPIEIIDKFGTIAFTLKEMKAYKMVSSKPDHSIFGPLPDLLHISALLHAIIHKMKASRKRQRMSVTRTNLL